MTADKNDLADASPKNGHETLF